MNTKQTETPAFQNGYSDVNGLRMYYEIYGEGRPLVLLHGGGSTIQSTFGNIIPLFAGSRKLIAVELQAHGRTGDRNTQLSFEQDADDVAALLRNLDIASADIFGFSNGGTTAMQIAIRHPDKVNKLVLGSALAKRDGVPSGFWDFMQQASLGNMPALLKKSFLDVNPDSAGLQNMHDKDARRMQQFADIPDEKIKAINAKTLLIVGDRDVVSVEHTLALSRLIPVAELAVIPGTHGEYIGEITTIGPGFSTSALAVPLIEKFLDKKEN